MAFMLSSPSQYVLGGIGAPARGISESFQAGLAANLGRQDARQGMQARAQQMDINAATERRTQQMFDLALQDRALAQQRAAAGAAAAASRRAQYNDFLNRLSAGYTGGAPAAAPAAAPAVGPVVAGNRPGTVGLSFGGGGGAAPVTPGLSYGRVGGGGSASNASGMTGGAGVDVARGQSANDQLLGMNYAGDTGALGMPGAFIEGIMPPAMQGLPMGGPGTFSVPGAPSAPPVPSAPATAGLTLPTGGPGTFPVAPSPLVTFGGQPFAIPEVDRFAPRAAQALQEQQREAYINSAIRSISGAIGTGDYRPTLAGRAYGYFADNPYEAQQRAENQTVMDWFQSRETQAFLRENPELIPQATANPAAFMRRFQGGFPATPATATTPAAGVTPPVTAGAAAPPAAGVTPPGGTMPPGPAPARAASQAAQNIPISPVQSLLMQGGPSPSQTYAEVPTRLLQDNVMLQRQREQAVAAMEFHRNNGNAEGMMAAMAQIDALDQEQRYLDGMTGIESIMRGDFGLMQALLQQQNPGEIVELRPFNDGTVQIVVNGQVEADLPVSQFVESLRMEFDQQYAAAVAAQAQQYAELNRMAAEEAIRTEAQGALERGSIFAQAEADAELAAREARLKATGVEVLDDFMVGDVAVRTIRDTAGNTYNIVYDPNADVVVPDASGQGMMTQLGISVNIEGMWIPAYIDTNGVVQARS